MEFQSLEATLDTFEFDCPAEDAEVLVRAVQLAYVAHGKQVRKWSKKPYIVHPAEVATEMGMLGERVQAAAWMHDIIEDNPQYEVDVYNFPKDVALLVEALTRRSTQSKSAYIERFKIYPKEAMLIKMADRRLNVRDALSELPDPRVRAFMGFYLPTSHAILKVARGMGLGEHCYYTMLEEELEASVAQMA